MAEAEHNFIQNDEQQDFSLQESDPHHFTAGEFDPQNIAGNMHGDYGFVGDESGNEQGFTGNDPGNSYGVMPEQNYPENETEHTLDADQGNQDLAGNESKQEFTENEASELANASDNSHTQKKEVNENNLVGGGEKKWPGWPGESVFRMLVPAQKVGNIIGRKGEYIKKIVEETKSRVKVLDGPPGSQERAVLWANFKATNQSPMPMPMS